MLDFTSSLYLGMAHASWELAAWDGLTTGRPAALAAPPGADAVAAGLASLQGTETGLLLPSTLHAFWDLGGLIEPSRYVLLVDTRSYPVARWGVERAAARGARVIPFDHGDPASFRKAADLSYEGREPLIVCDGVCTGCGRLAPLDRYVALTRLRGGWVLVDDTQGLGLFGEGRSAADPFGRGGGGLLRAWNGQDGSVVLVASLAKSFGVPMTVVSGSAHVIDAIRHRSGVLVHTSPPSVAHLHAAERALCVNTTRGDALRQRLLSNLRTFQRACRSHEVPLKAVELPIQTIAPASCGRCAAALYRLLLNRGLRGVLHRDPHGRGPAVSLLITAAHTPDDMRTAARGIRDAIGSLQRATTHCFSMKSRKEQPHVDEQRW